MGPRPQPQRLCPLKFHKLALGAATLPTELPHPKNWAGYASAYKVFYGTDPKQICTASVDLEIPVNYKSVQEWIKDVTEIEELVNQSVSDNLEQSREVMN